MTLGDILVRTAASFVVLLVLTRLLGKKQVGHLTFFNYATGITFGSTTAEVIVNRHITMLQGFASLALWAFMAYLVALIGLRSGKARAVLDGQPTILVKQGRILERALGAQHLNMDDLSMLLRAKDVFSLDEVETAILEPNGELSVLLKEAYLPATKKDMKITPGPSLFIPMELIVDGKAIEHNLKELGVSRTWLAQQLKKQGVPAIENAFYAELQPDGTLYLDRYEDGLET